MAGRNTISVEAVHRRRYHIAQLKIYGLSINAICEEVNNLSDTEGWGIVHRRMVFYDMNIYFKENPLDKRAHSYIQNKALLDNIEQDIDCISREIESRDLYNNWTPFEKARCLVRRHRMLINYGNIMGWNYGKNAK